MLKKLGIAVISVTLIFSAVMIIWIINDASMITKSKKSVAASLDKNNAVSIKEDLTDAEKTRALVGKQNYEDSLHKDSNSVVFKPRMVTLDDAQKSKTASFNDKIGPIKSISKWIPYETLFDNEDLNKYANQVVFFTGQVFRIDGSDAVLVNVQPNSEFMKPLVLKYNKDIVNGILSKGNYITFWGNYNGWTLYTDSLGSKYNIPVLTALIIE